MIKRLLALLICLVIVTGTLSGCDSSANKPIALAIVLGCHACANEFTVEAYKELSDLIRRAVYGGYISITICDGDPVVIRSYGKEVYPKNARNHKFRQKAIEDRTQEVLSFLQNRDNRALSDENDTLGAIVQAERSLHVEEAKGLEKYIIVMDTGIPTAGNRLNLQDVEIGENSAENGEIDEIVRKMEERTGILPNLEGINVKFIGLGDVASPQELPATIEVQLVALWKAILSACGATFNDDDVRIKARGRTANVYSEDEGGFRYVTPIRFPSDKIEHKIEFPPIPEPEPDDPESEEPPLPLPPPPTPPPITSELVPFKPDLAEYYNDAEAKRVLSEYAKWITGYFEAYPESDVIYVVGFIAKVSLGDENRLNTRLSEQRAERVKETLVECGIEAEKLYVIGLGVNGRPFRVDEFPNGVFDTVVAQKNRKVMLIPDLSEEAAIVLAEMQELNALRR